MNARKTPLGPQEVRVLLCEVDVVYTGRGRSVLRFDLRRDPGTREDAVQAVLGRSGTLKAPAVRVGRRLLAGFQEQAWAEVLEKK